MPLGIGPGPAYRPPAPARPGAAGLGCRATIGVRRAFHVELFAHRHVILVAPGIGVTGARREGARVVAGTCFAPLVTLDPTGVVELGSARRRLRLGDVFALWGQGLSSTRLGGFAGAPVRAWVDGRAVGGDPRAIVLAPHLEIVLEIAGYVPPHVSYAFPPGL